MIKEPGEPRFDPWEGWLGGPENALARAAAGALAKGEGVSPLVVHGPSGVGKSRLLEGLVEETIGRRPESAVASLGAERFAALCIEAEETTGGWAEFRERFRRLDLFVLDDLHALERSPMGLAELAHTLDALDEAGAAVAVAARSGPGQWSGWPVRLVNRLVGGLAVRVDPPGPEARRRYVLERARARKITLPSGAVDALAEAADGYRTLDGLLARLALEARLDPQASDRGRVEELIAEDGLAAGVGVETVARDVAKRFGVSMRDLRSASRRAGLVVPRHLAIHLAREVTGLSFAALGEYFGRRDAASIRHACRASADRLGNDPALAAVASALKRRWRADERES